MRRGKRDPDRRLDKETGAAEVAPDAGIAPERAIPKEKCAVVGDAAVLTMVEEEGPVAASIPSDPSDKTAALQPRRSKGGGRRGSPGEGTHVT